jgi:2Fe-2S ferredoxin
MPTIRFVNHLGESTDVEAETGCSVMEAAVDHGLTEIVAECGGALSCATCQVYVASRWLERLPEPDPAELEMLEFAVDPKPNSRLSCQIIVTDALDGMEVETPESQY